jgi:hypothetical protein
VKFNKNTNEMNLNKVYTTAIFGKYVRLLGFSLFLVFCTISCVDEPLTTDVIDNITGTWGVTETSGSGDEQTFQVTITKVNDNTVKISNFNLLGITVEVDVSGLDLNIPSQTVDGFDISGNGTASRGYNRIDLDYTVDDGGGIETYSAVLIRK